MLTGALDQAVVTGFAGDVLTVAFKSPFVLGLFKPHQQQLEQAAAQVAGRAIKISLVIDENLPSPALNKLSEPDRSNLTGAMKIFGATDVEKLND